jgi:repressor LexA
MDLFDNCIYIQYNEFVMQKQKLTDRQQKIFDFLKESIDRKGFPPSVKEIQDNFEFKSPTAAQDHLNVLARKGHILRHPNISRGIELIAKEQPMQEHAESSSIPVVGHIAAGTPILAQENIESTVAIDNSLFKDSENLFALHVKGDSMIKAGICSGDYAIIHSQPTVERGEIGAVIIDEEATLKRIFILEDSVKLVPENDKMETIVVHKGKKSIYIAGKLKGIIRKI